MATETVIPKTITAYEDILLLVDALALIGGLLGPPWARTVVGLALDLVGFTLLAIDLLRLNRLIMKPPPPDHPLLIQETKLRRQISQEDEHIRQSIETLRRAPNQNVKVRDLEFILADIQRVFRLQTELLERTGLLFYRLNVERYAMHWLSGPLTKWAILLIVSGFALQMLAFVG